MELFRVTRDAWGQETLSGVSWDLFWVFIGAALAFIVAHVLYQWLRIPGTAQAGPADSGADTANRVTRHKLVDRAYHWTMAATVLTLLGTSFIPILGFKFPWIDAHWIAGMVLTIIVGCHMLRALIWQDRKAMAIGLDELRGLVRKAGAFCRRRAVPAERSGRYSAMQKVYHYAIAALILLAVATGLLMMAKIDGPFWTRDPYMLSSSTWALIYVAHDLAAMSVLAAIMVHVYFAVRPEKLWNTRSMILGWITRSEYRTHYDPGLWRAEAVEPGTRAAIAVAPER